MDGTPVFDIRCSHIDYARPSNDANEFHWRCVALMPMDTNPPDGKAAAYCWYCPAHSHAYIPGRTVQHEQLPEIMAETTPSARAFLRETVPHIMRRVPVTATESQAVHEATVLSRWRTEAVMAMRVGRPIPPRPGSSAPREYDALPPVPSEGADELVPAGASTLWDQWAQADREASAAERKREMLEALIQAEQKPLDEVEE
jgi:hypothetical protein